MVRDGVERINRAAIQTLKKVLLRAEDLEGRLDEDDFWGTSSEG